MISANGFNSQNGPNHSGGMQMKKLSWLLLFGGLCLPLLQLHAQEKPKSEERAKVPTPVKVQIVFTEYDGDKKVSSMPYAFTVITDERVGGNYSTRLRTGIRVPIETDGKDQKTTYMDIGTNIDCGIKSEDDGRYHLYLIFDRPPLYPTKSPEGARLVPNPVSHPVVRQCRTDENL